MTAHLAKVCTQCPANVKKYAQDEVSKKQQNSSTASKRLILEDSESDEDGNLCNIITPETSPAPKLKATPSSSSGANLQVAKSAGKSSGSGTLDGFAVTTSNALKEKIDAALARAVYMSNCPFNLLDNDYWQHALNLLRPSYIPPSAYKIGTPLLNAEYSSVMEASKNQVKSAPCLGLMTDGWTNITGDNLINFVISTPDPVFIKTVAPGINRETSEFISTEVVKIIDDLVSDGVDEKKFFVLITDNASNMRAMWVKITEKYPHIVVIGCCAHTLNLLLTDIIKQPSVLELRKAVKQIILAVKHHHVVLAFFKATQKEKYGNKAVSLKLPPKTRWFYLAITLNTLLKNKAALQATVIQEGLDVNKEVRKNVLDNDHFWSVVEEMYNIMSPVAAAISRVESDSVVLSDVPELAKRITKKVQPLIECSSVLTDEEKSACSAAMIKRLHYCTSDAHCAANLLDPRYKGRSLDVVEVQSAISFISDQCVFLDLDKKSVLANLAEYRTKTGFFTDKNIWEPASELPPSTWWGAFCAEQPLFPIAQRLFNVLCSAAPCERNWSCHGSVHTKTRNRTLKERVEKQVAIRCNMRFSQNAINNQRVKKTDKRKANVLEDQNSEDNSSDKEECVPDSDLILGEFDCDSDQYSASETDSEISDDDDVPIGFLYPQSG